MKKKSVLIISLLFTMLFSTAVSAEKNSTDNFKKTRNYENQFADVGNSEWYASSVSQAYEYGLVSGNSETSYNPAGNVSIAETIALACRLNNIYTGNNAKFEGGDEWYQPYVEYALDNKIIESEYGNYNASATRREFAKILSNSMPKDALTAINDISDIPDVDGNESNIYMLYNAGILAGNDKYGTFNPTSNIQRSEVAAIIVRMADKTQRKEFTLDKKPVDVESVTLDKNSISMTVGDTENLTATISPNNATDKNLVWKSSNTSVATVDDGKIKAVGEGSAVITITTANQKTAECKISVEKKPMTNTTVYEDSKVKIDFLRVEKYKYGDDRVNVYFDAKNKTNETITIQCDALSLNGYCFNYTIMSDDVSANSTGTVDTTLKKFDFDLVDISNISTVGGQFRIISDTKSFSTYDALFTNVDVYNGGNIKKYPSADDKELLYSDSKINMYFDYAENDDEDFEVYLTVQNKTNETILIQNDTVVINGRSYDHTIMSDPILPYTTGNVNVSVKDTKISGNVSTVGGQFRIISDAKSFKTYDAVLGKTSNTSGSYDEDDNYDDEDYNSKIDSGNATSKLLNAITTKGTKLKDGARKLEYSQTTTNGYTVTTKIYNYRNHENLIGMQTIVEKGDIFLDVSFDYDISTMNAANEKMSACYGVIVGTSDFDIKEYSKNNEYVFTPISSSQNISDELNGVFNSWVHSCISTINLICKSYANITIEDLGFGTQY